MIIFVSYDISKDEFVLFLQGIVSFWKIIMFQELNA